MTTAPLAEFTLIPAAQDIMQWAQAAQRHAQTVLDASSANDFACEGTWFVGVDGLPNQADGTIAKTPFPSSIRAAIGTLGPAAFPLHKAQISAVYSGYPKPRAGENAAQFAYREKRHAAHVDGLIAEGPNRRRKLREPHCYILGIPLGNVDTHNSPLIYWQGSAERMAHAFQSATKGMNAAQISEFDFTDIYQAARKECFDTCKEISVKAKMGSAFLLNPLTLHGIGPWTSERKGPRIVIYFRPQYAQSDLEMWPLAARSKI